VLCAKIEINIACDPILIKKRYQCKLKKKNVGNKCRRYPNLNLFINLFGP